MCVCVREKVEPSLPSLKFAIGLKFAPAKDRKARKLSRRKEGM